MNLINQHLDKNNLHHAYLIEGSREEIIPEILKFLEDLGIKTSNNPDFCHISVDSFKIEDARNLKSVEYEKGFSSGKKIYIISANIFLLEAQNTLLKIFEEPIENTHFFITIPNVDSLLRTLVSRFYLIRTKPALENQLKEAKEFVAMSIKDRIDFLKKLLDDSEDEKENSIETSSPRSKALNFLNALELVIHKKIYELKPDSKNNTDFFDQIFKVREFLSQPGSSVKTLMESIALVVPSF